MTPEDFKKIRNVINLSQRKLALLIDKNFRTVQRYEKGEIKISQKIAVIMRYLEQNLSKGLISNAFIKRNKN